MKNEAKNPEMNDLIIQSYVNEMLLRDILKRNNLKTASIEEKNEIANRAKERVNNLLATYNF